MEFCDKRVARFAQRRREWLEMHGLLHASSGVALQAEPTSIATGKWWRSGWCDCSFVALVLGTFSLFYWRFPCL